MTRQALSRKTRFDVFKRDGFCCAYCGAHPSQEVLLEVDHIRPVADGGTNDIDNLVTACWDCNRGKGARLLSRVPQSLEDKADETLEREAQIRAFNAVMEAARERREDDLWAVAEIFMGRFGDEDIQRTRLSSIRMFLEKLPLSEVIEAMTIACDKKYSRAPAFSYFAGICWRKIKRANGEDV